MQVEGQMDSGILHFIRPKMAIREGATGTRFNIPLESDGCVLIDKCKVRDHNPRSEFRGVRRSSVPVIQQSLLEIARQTGVSLVRRGFRLQNVDVIHNSKISSWLASRSLDAIGRPAFATATARSLQPSICASHQAKAGAGDETRTRDVLLGKEVLYH